MLRLSALTSSFRALSVSRVAPASAGARVGFTASRQANGIHSTAVAQDKATGAEPGIKKPRAPRKPKAVDGDAAVTPAKKPSTRAKSATTPKKPTEKVKKVPAVKKVAKVAKPAGPPRPKRVLHPPKLIRSAWLLYYTERCAQLPADEKKSVVELSQRLVEEFRKLDPEEREELNERLEAAHVEYEQKLKTWRESVTPQMIAEENEYRRKMRKTSTKKQKQRLLRDESQPKKPLNGYIRYCEYVRHNPQECEKVLGTANQKEIVAVEQAKALSVGWKALSDAEKAPFNEAYQKDKAVYEKDLEAWKQEHGVTSA